MKRLLVIGLILATVVLILPTMLVLFLTNNTETTQPTHQAVAEVSTESVPTNNISVAVFRSKQDTIEEIGLEDYVVGVVASEMGPNFELEALKAQAIAARTYIVRHMLNPNGKDDRKLPDGATVNDTEMYQVYHSPEELKAKWSDYEANMNKIRQAVYATQGEVLTFEGEPIEALFFSTSNGFTENSEDYWTGEIPYLRSVESPWDKESPRYEGQTQMTVAELETKLGVTLPAGDEIGEIVSRTKGNRVSKVIINNKEFTGRDIRELLGLDSSDFQWHRNGNTITFVTRGWGHGVGMSQYGAEGMAKEGKTYKDIIEHYYNGVSLTTVEPFVGALMAHSGE
ncbi:stage II sporulation protein D [Alkalihalobacterium bogoriense]|uniref:stage II sporulation protein D n=1 Tax=Alkalihalobacterium bogoriense TaxID=246272 RepID=UPI00047A46C8|nr:stage II sporulation protein D [Alkalihalobacterium bogoriense]